MNARMTTNARKNRYDRDALQAIQGWEQRNFPQDHEVQTEHGLARIYFDERFPQHGETYRVDITDGNELLERFKVSLVDGQTMLL